MEMLPDFTYLSFQKLKVNNIDPRLPKSLHGASEEKLIEFMLLDASLIELMLAIGENGFFPGEQLLVVPDTDGMYKTIEGNRRLSAVKLLNKPSIATVQKSKVQKVIEETDQRPSEIPCLIFKEESEIHNYLGYRHITGIKEWRLLEKARYLNELRNSNFSSYNLDQAAREIAKIIGSRKDYVRRVLVGFQIYKIIEDNAFYRIRDLDDTSFYFNYIADSLNKTHIARFLGVDFSLESPTEDLNEENLEKWTRWLYEKNDQNRTRLIGTSSDLNDLNAILGNEEAKAAFDEKGYSLERAKELTGELDINFANYIIKAVELLAQADSLVIKVKDFYPDLDDDLKAVKRLSNKIKSTVDEIKDEDE